MKIGIFGGTFNPPHIAHLILAESLYESLNLDKIIFIPSSLPPHKKCDDLLDAEHRLRLIQLAIGNNDRFEVSDIEVQRGGTSYTVDTVRTLDEKYKNDTLYLIIGADNLKSFHLWRDYEALLRRCTLIAMRRPGSTTEEVREDVLGDTRIVDVPYLDVSSTEIRRKIRGGKSVRYLVPDAVLSEIEKSGFYKNR
jgi:nicotinate-nucleotide adenylyltransferase